MPTYSTKAKDIQRQWYVVDAEGQILGRLASRVARILRGKHKPLFTPYLDNGDYVIVINASKVRVTGKKLREKIYYRHSGYPGGLKSIALGELLKKKPQEAVRKAIWGMLPHNSLGRKMIKKLKVYPQAEHPHTAQDPQPLAEERRS